MALLEETLFGINDKVAIAIQRLRTFELAEAPCDDHINYDNVPYKVVQPATVCTGMSQK